MISNNNTRPNKSDSSNASDTREGNLNVCIENSTPTNFSPKCIKMVGVSRPVFQDVTNQHSMGENLDRLKVSPKHRNMAELEHELDVVVTTRPQKRIAPNDNNFNYSQTYVSSGTLNSSNSLNSSLNRSTTLSSDELNKCKRPRKARSIFSVDQLKILNEEFERHNYINNYTREELAARVGITPEQVKIWFQNMRSKRRKFHERAHFNPLGYEYAIQQYGNIASVAPQHHPYHPANHPSQLTNGSRVVPANVMPSTPTNYAGANGNHTTSFAFVNANGGGHRQNNGNLNQPQQPNNLYWESSNKTKMNNNKCGGIFVPQNNLPYNSSTNQVYVTPSPHNYPPSKDHQDHRDNSAASSNVHMAHNSINSSNSSKGASFTAPGFASTLYAAKLNSESKNVANDMDNQSKPATTYLLNSRPANNVAPPHDSQGNPITKQYATSTPHKNNAQMNSNNFYSNSLQTFPSNAKPRIYPPKNTAPNNAQSSMRPNH